MNICKVSNSPPGSVLLQWRSDVTGLERITSWGNNANTTRLSQIWYGRRFRRYLLLARRHLLCAVDRIDGGRGHCPDSGRRALSQGSPQVHHAAGHSASDAEHRSYGQVQHCRQTILATDLADWATANDGVGLRSGQQPGGDTELSGLYD